MVIPKIVTRSQKMLAIPLLAGLLAAIGGTIYLFFIPTDPKNSLIGEFSVFRLIEAGGLLTTSVIFGVFLGKISSNSTKADRIADSLDWQDDYPRSMVIAFILFILCLLCSFSMADLFSSWAAILIRLSPVFLSASVFLFAFLSAFVFLRPNRHIQSDLMLLGQTALVLMSIGFLLGLFLFPAKTGLILRQGNLIFIGIIALLLYTTLQFQEQHSFFACLFFISMLFFGSLVGVWTSGISDYNIFAGLLPFNDANGYYHGGRLIVEGYPMHSFSSRRPLLPALLGVFYWMGGENLQFVIGCLVLVILISIVLAVWNIQKTAGSEAAVFLAIFLFLFIRQFIGSTMTEMLGMPLGTIGFVLIWDGAIRKKIVIIAAGLLMLSLGLIARAGPFLILPMLIIWVGWALKGDKKFNFKAAGFALGAVVVAFVLNQIVFQSIKGETSTSMANFSYTLYGLVSGGTGWMQYSIDHPEVRGLLEPQLSREVYKYALDTFLSNPILTVKGAIKYWGDFFNLDWYGAFGFIQGVSSFDTSFVRWLVALLSFTGMVSAIKQIRKAHFSMIVAGVLGVVLSVPFVPTIDAQTRTYAASIPWFAGLGMLGMIEIVQLVKSETVHKVSHIKYSETSRTLLPLLCYSMILVVLMIIFPIFMRMFIKPVDMSSSSRCVIGQDRIITTVSSGSYVNVVADDSLTVSFVPNLRFSDLDLSIHNSPVFRPYLIANPVQPGSSLFLAYDRMSNKFVNVIAPTDVLTFSQGLSELCGQWGTDTENSSFFFVESAYKQGK